MLRIYLTNLGRYNEGELVGEWLTLPASEDEIQACLKRIGIDQQHEEFFITDYETELEGLTVDEYDSVTRLNEIARELDQLQPDQLLALQAFMVNGSDFDQALEGVQRGDYFIYYDVDSMTDVARQVVEIGGYLEGIPERVAYYFDYERFGRDLNIEGTFIFIGSDCCVEINK